MITTMRKYTFLVFHRDYESFLSKLRDLGVVHIDMKAQGLADNPEMQAALEKADTLRHILSQQMTDEQLKERNQIQSRIADIDRELARLAPLGDFSSKTIERLGQNGFPVSVYTCPKSRYQEEWGTILAEQGGNILFVSFGGECPEEATLFPLGEKDPLALRQDREAIVGLLAACDARIAAWWLQHKAELENELHEAEQAIDWTKVVLNTEHVADHALCLVEGFAPEGTWEPLDDMLAKADVYFESSEPTEEDNTPIKLKNNRITRLFECLTGMYGMPSYGEFDPTPILAPFYLLFFALCMGDMAYGIILILFGLLQTKKIVNIAMFDGLGPIITTLGVATAVVGFFMNTVFGVPVTMLDWHPAKIAGYDFWMVAAIVIGVFHICLAMTVKAICYTVRFGFKQTISTWGWLLLIVGTIATMLIGMALELPTAYVQWTMIAIGAISALGIFIFNTPGRNPLINIGAGLWDTYQMATGLLGDVLSYIRLYALGLAGGMLGNAFNDLALNMVWGDGEGSILALAGRGIGVALILLLGHTLNILMACLGAFVHPLRLTFVEYFKNAGYEGKGELYSPFKA